MTCKFKAYNFFAEIINYLHERNSVKYNVSDVSESFSLLQSKIKD